MKSASLGTITAMAALCILIGANLVQLVGANTALHQAIDRQASSEPAIAKVNAQLDALASATQRLADTGDANAAKIVATLGDNGIRIKTSH